MLESLLWYDISISLYFFFRRRQTFYYGGENISDQFSCIFSSILQPAQKCNALHSYTLICYKSFSTGNWLGLRSLKSRDGISGKQKWCVCVWFEDTLRRLPPKCSSAMPKALLIIFKTYWVLFPPWSSYRDFFHIQNVFLSFSGVHYLSSWTVNLPDSRQENSTKSWLIVCTGISTLIMHSFSSWKTLKYATGFVTFNNPKAAYILSLSLYSYYFYLSCSTTTFFSYNSPKGCSKKDFHFLLRHHNESSFRRKVPLLW